jgi:Xaa-Pro dipeptidase
LYPRFSEGEYARRYRAIREAMAKDGLDAILISGARGSSEIHYLSNYLAQSPCWLFFPREGAPAVFIHFFNHQPCAKAQSIIRDIRWYGPAPIPTLADTIRQRELVKSKIGLVSMRSMAYGHVTELKRLFPEVEWVEFGPAFSRIRRVRSEEELAYFRRSGYLTDLACEALEEQLRPGLTEHDILSIVL